MQNQSAWGGASSSTNGFKPSFKQQPTTTTRAQPPQQQQQPICRNFNSPKGCPYGNTCKFSHVKINTTSSNNNTKRTDAEDKTSQYVVHCRRAKYDVYIGRPNPSISETDCRWGNPFKIGPDGDRADVIRKYEEWIRERPDLMKEAKRDLKGKVLACWCAPQACHGNVLAQIANFE